MTDHGNDNEPDLWANTGSQPWVPPAQPLADDPAANPTLVQPSTPGQPEPTAIQPVTPGPLNSPATAAGIVAGSGMPPARPPLPPTGGGPGGPGGPGDSRDPGAEQPAWLIPSAIGLGIGALAALAIFLITNGGDDDSVSTDVSTTTSIVQETTLPTDTTIVETTVAVDTTIAVETTVPPETTLALETTIVPTTPAPTTPAPTTVAPTTTADPAGITPAAPGQMLVADTGYDIVSACTSNPVTGYVVRSFVAFGESGPLVVEEGDDEGNTFGMFSDEGIRTDTDEYQDFGDAGFGMLAFEGDGFFEVAANPGDIALQLCATRGTVRLSDPAAPEFGYSYGIVDMCASTPPFSAIGYVSEGGTIRIVDNEDGTAEITFDTIDLFSATDPAATITEVDGRQQIEGQVTGSTIDGDTTQAIFIDIDPATARGCFGSESP
jgi:hypothetical protein